MQVLSDIIYQSFTTGFCEMTVAKSLVASITITVAWGTLLLVVGVGKAVFGGK